jgi:hypothetical protein
MEKYAFDENDMLVKISNRYKNQHAHMVEKSRSCIICGKKAKEHCNISTSDGVCREPLCDTPVCRRTHYRYHGLK